MEFEPITSLDRALALSKRCLDRGLARNCYLGPEDYRRAVAEGTLRALEREDGVFLLLCRPAGFERLCFAAQPGAEAPEWDPDAPLVAEVPRREEAPDAAEACLARWGFTKRLERIRLRRAGAEEGSGEIPASVCLAEPEDLDAVRAFLARHFDRLTGCLPTAEELAGERCWLIPGPKGPRGVLHARLERRGGEIRHLALDEDLRGTDAARALVSACHAALGRGESRVWAAAENGRALRFYQKCDYRPDGFHSTVWIKEN